MAKYQVQPNHKVRQIFDDLEKYLAFCQDYGYKFDEADLYNQRSYVFRQFAKFSTGRDAKDGWAELIARS
jgi:hypothetical protein